MTNIWFLRTPEGKIGLWSEVQQNGEEWETIDRDAPEFQAILNPPAPVPPIISDRQFFQQLAVAGLITEDEALAAVQTGTLPAAILSFIDELPTEQRFAAKMLLTGATQFVRANPLVDAFGAMYGMTSEQVDDLWRAAAEL